MELVVQNAIDAASLGSLFALLALGIALIFGVMQLVNFAHGELIMIGGYSVFFLRHQPWPLMILGTVAIVLVAAFLMERVAFRPVRGANPSTLLVTSFALSFLLQNLGILTVGARPKGVNVGAVGTEFFEIGDLRISTLAVLTMAVTAILVAALVAFLKRTSLGVQMRAAAEDFQMARLLGVSADRVIATAFAISGMLAAVASVLFVAQTGTVTPSMGVSLVLVAFVATIVGGMGSLPGAALGGFLLGTLTVALQASLPLHLRAYRDAFVFTIVIGVLFFRPQGLVPPRHARTGD